MREKQHIIDKIKDTQTRSGRIILTIAVDLDGVLCYGEYWGKENVKPNTENIKFINELSLSHYIVIHTARRREWAKHTINWLHRYNVRYHAIHFDKMPADVYIDDKAVNIIEHFKKEEKNGEK